MTTGKDYGLPEEYADWVEADAPQGKAGEYVAVNIGRFPAASAPFAAVFRFPTDTVTSYFVPPKPKPTLPDVKPGAVVSWRANTSSSRRRGTLLSDGRWQVAIRNGDSGCILGAHAFWSKEDVLLDVDDDGFTVELDGLE